MILSVRHGADGYGGGLYGGPATVVSAAAPAAVGQGGNRQQSGGQNKEQANSNISLDPHDT